MNGCGCAFWVQIMGSALVGVAAWGQQNSAYLHELIPEGGFNLAIAAGSMLLIISIAGVVGTAASFYKCASCRV